MKYKLNSDCILSSKESTELIENNICRKEKFQSHLLHFNKSVEHTKVIHFYDKNKKKWMIKITIFFQFLPVKSKFSLFKWNLSQNAFY